MSNPGDNGSWTPQGNDFNAQNGGHDASAQPAQDPWAQPPAGQDPYAQPSAGSAADPYGQASARSAADPYGQASGASASDPYGQQGTGQGSYGQDPFAQDASAQPGQDPWAQPPAGQDPFAQPSAASAADPYGQASGASASDPYGQPGAGQGQQSWSAAGSGASASDPYGQAPGAGPAPQGQAQSRLVVGLLGIFLGGFGVHRFLMGYTTIGIIQIAVTIVTCGFGAWWGLIEGIMVLAKSPSFERDAHGRPLTD